MNPTQFLADYGPYALVTGASSGIGLAFAEVLAEFGLNLVLVARRENQLESIASDLNAKHGITALSIAVDLADASACDHLLSRTQELDIGLVISNAGFSTKGEFCAIDRQQMMAMIHINCHAPLLLARGFIPRLQQRAKAGLVFTSSIEALIGTPYSTAYSASKALVKNLGEGLWAELQGSGVDVLTLCPGATDTEGLAKNGFDASAMAHVMTADAVARATLNNITNGPVFISSEHYQAMFEQLLALPRGQALQAMANSIKGSINPAPL